MPPVAREAAELVADRSTHLVRLVHELLELTELDAGSAPIRWEPVDPRAVLTAVLARRGRTMPIEGEGVTTHADKARLERILGNLVDNAFEHADGRGVGASIRVDDGEVLIAVTDEGPGIPEGDVPFRFESFYKGDRSRRAHRGGIGMGLPIAYENARLLGADIAVDSEVGRGSTFTLRLPIRESPPAGGSDER